MMNIDELKRKIQDSRELYGRQKRYLLTLLEHAEAPACSRWEIDPDGYYPCCAACGNEPPGRVMTDYCPNCGARMDGGVHNAESSPD